MFKRCLRKLAWNIIKKTNNSNIPQVAFKHDCGSESVIPLGDFSGMWKNPTFECLGCGCVTNEGITARLVNPNDESIKKMQKEGKIVLSPQY